MNASTRRSPKARSPVASTQFVILVLPSDLPRSCPLPLLLLLLSFPWPRERGPRSRSFPFLQRARKRASACRASEFFAFYRFIIKAGPLHRLPISGDRDATLATQSDHAVLLECTNLFSDPLSPSDRVQRRGLLSLSLSSPFLLSLILTSSNSRGIDVAPRFCHFSTNPSRFEKIFFAILDFNLVSFDVAFRHLVFINCD